MIFTDITFRKAGKDALKVKAQQQQIVAKFGQIALKEHDLKKLFNKCVKLLAKTLKVEYCKILELLPDKNTLLLKSGIGWRKELIGRATLEIGKHSQAGYTLLIGKPVIVNDLHKETRFRGSPLLLEHKIVSGISVIVGDINNPYGVLCAHTIQYREFSKDDVNFMLSIANLLASAIERKKTENTLLKLSRAVEQTADHVFITDKNGYFEYVNPAFQQCTGYSLEDCLGKTPRILKSDKHYPYS